MPTTVRSHAKINLGLYIGAPRPDGFHALVTVYQTLEMHDLVTVSARHAARTSIRITSNDRRVPTDSRNTAWKMVERGLQLFGVSAEVEIHIEKHLPVQGGLGAGSANAVAALIGLEAELQMSQAGAPELPAPGYRLTASSRRLEISAQVGSDVPLFLIGGTILGLDRGQEVYPLPDIEPVWCVVATPSVGVSTPQAFRDWDAHCAAEGLTQEASAVKLKELSRAYASAFAGNIPKGRQAGSSGVPPHSKTVGGDLAGPLGSALVRTGITSWIANDFERVVFRQHPSLAEIKRLLASSGTPEAALHASLSGSGSALFGLYLTREMAEAACARLQAAGVASTLTRTLPRPKYWGQMLQP
ncbi:4-(cytidine 5'-diphospho)-2-C-methyl-D-erythritol kinase [Occallatibacter riparius]|uniref:4-diphosphocytidyl-2-C-methyl-D-erythritol kinase n=1 Tax=Occallatibacter riparius TaxID=1002689 RepID=A0A9J7BVK7_9BACT|nr:4-(cytidine 5'-diphospho)-2-C-methyl-D-erythritol kinase [Occallatibacter riparius]UWZ85045.1 4-(cytidine 5'-diphospho)-2-C-methyl-D-erythritol kinase [Occallatibacter riparius]